MWKLDVNKNDLAKFEYISQLVMSFNDKINERNRGT